LAVASPFNPAGIYADLRAQATTAADTGALALTEGSYIVAVPGDDLAVKYAAAAALEPNGTALANDNRAALVLMPGAYALAAELAVNTDYVDVIALGSQEAPSVLLTGFTINVTATNVVVRGISVGTREFRVSPRPDQASGTVTGTHSNNTINWTDHGLQIGDVISFTSLTGGDGLSTGVRYAVRASNFTSNSFRLEIDGTQQNFTTDITAAAVRIEYNSSQRLIDCVGGGISFGGMASTASGLFINCTGGFSGFGGDGGTASGTFTDCTGGSFSFGGVGTASGTFINCTGGEGSFGGEGTLSGTLRNCYSSGTFETPTGGGVIYTSIDSTGLVHTADVSITGDVAITGELDATTLKQGGKGLHSKGSVTNAGTLTGDYAFATPANGDYLLAGLDDPRTITINDPADTSTTHTIYISLTQVDGDGVVTWAGDGENDVAAPGGIAPAMSSEIGDTDVFRWTWDGTRWVFSGAMYSVEDLT
jgi:hypothetical protein